MMQDPLFLIALGWFAGAITTGIVLKSMGFRR